jgi:hypothetical protein
MSRRWRVALLHAKGKITAEEGANAVATVQFRIPA